MARRLKQTEGKTYLRTSINFGRKSDPARILIRKFIEKNGDVELSKFIRYLVVQHLSKDSSCNKWEIDMLLNKRKSLGKEISKLAEEMRGVDDELREKGVDVDSLLFSD